jgi:hypothetical protein
VSQSYSLLLSVGLQRRDERVLDFLYGDPIQPEGVCFHPMIFDPPCTVGSSYDGAGNVGGVLAKQPMWDDRIRYGGWSNLPYRITGIVTDESGNPISNTVLSLFRASDDTWMYDAVSKDGGQYDFGVTDNTTAYYIVAFNAGIGKQGVTVQTLTGA